MSPALTIVILVFAYSLYLGYLASRPEEPRLLDPDIWDEDPAVHKRNYIAAMNAYRARQGLPALAPSPRKRWQFWRKPDDDTVFGYQHDKRGQARLSGRA